MVVTDPSGLVTLVVVSLLAPELLPELPDAPLEPVDAAAPDPEPLPETPGEAGEKRLEIALAFDTPEMLTASAPVARITPIAARKD